MPVYTPPSTLPSHRCGVTAHTPWLLHMGKTGWEGGGRTPVFCHTCHVTGMRTHYYALLLVLLMFSCTLPMHALFARSSAHRWRFTLPILLSLSVTFLLCLAAFPIVLLGLPTSILHSGAFNPTLASLPSSLFVHHQCADRHPKTGQAYTLLQPSNTSHFPFLLSPIDRTVCFAAATWVTLPFSLPPTLPAMVEAPYGTSSLSPLPLPACFARQLGVVGFLCKQAPSHALLLTFLLPSLPHLHIACLPMLVFTTPTTGFCLPAYHCTL